MVKANRLVYHAQIVIDGSDYLPMRVDAKAWE